MWARGAPKVGRPKGASSRARVGLAAQQDIEAATAGAQARAKLKANGEHKGYYAKGGNGKGKGKGINMFDAYTSYDAAPAPYQPGVRHVHLRLSPNRSDRSRTSRADTGSCRQIGRRTGTVEMPEV